MLKTMDKVNVPFSLRKIFFAYVINFKSNWDDHLSLIGFVYNNNYYSSIGMTPFEALYCRDVGFI